MSHANRSSLPLTREDYATLHCISTGKRCPCENDAEPLQKLVVSMDKLNIADETKKREALVQ